MSEVVVAEVEGALGGSERETRVGGVDMDQRGGLAKTNHTLSSDFFEPITSQGLGHLLIRVQLLIDVLSAYLGHQPSCGTVKEKLVFLVNVSLDCLFRIPQHRLLRDEDPAEGLPYVLILQAIQVLVSGNSFGRIGIPHSIFVLQGIHELLIIRNVHLGRAHSQDGLGGVLLGHILEGLFRAPAGNMRRVPPCAVRLALA